MMVVDTDRWQRPMLTAWRCASVLLFVILRFNRVDAFSAADQRRRNRLHHGIIGTGTNNHPNKGQQLTRALLSNRPSLIQRLDVTCSMSMADIHDTLCEQVAERFGLQLSDFTETYQAQTWAGPTAQGTAYWLSERSPQYLTGASFLTRTNQQQETTVMEELSINVWMGPSYDTPNMLLTFGQADVGGSYHVTADYVPRGATVLGNDPQYIEQYYGQDVQASWRDAYGSGAFPMTPAWALESRMLMSPAHISVTGLSFPQAEALVRNHVMRFLRWIDMATVVPSRSRGAFNMRDDKLRQLYFRGQFQQQVAALGPELGQVVATVNTGPIAEAYVGGGS